MRSSCIQHPKNEPLIIVRRWQLEATGGDKAAAALLSFFEYWHNVKLDQSRKAGEANDVAERHEDGRPNDESLVQHHNEQQLMEGAMLFGRNSLNRGIELLKKLGYVEVVPNPNPRYSFDKTRHFLFHPEKVNAWLDHRSDQPNSEDRSSQKGSRSARKGSRSAFLGGTSPETTSEITNESSDAGASEADPPNPASRQDDGPPSLALLRIFDAELSETRASRGTARDEARPVPRAARRALARDADRELGDGRDPELVEKGVRRMALRWDGHPLELAEAMGDVLDGKPWTPEQEKRRRPGSGGGTPAPPIGGERGERRRKEGFEWLFGEGEGEDRPPPDLEPEPEPEPEAWEGSAFEDVVPADRWGGVVDPPVAAKVRARLLELARSAGEEEYGAAVVELRRAPWVGEAFKERVLEKAAELRREAG